MAAWQKAAGLVHQCNSEKTVSKPHLTVHFVSWYSFALSQARSREGHPPRDPTLHRARLPRRGGRQATAHPIPDGARFAAPAPLPTPRVCDQGEQSG